MAFKYTVFPEKTILKWNKELVELHKRVIKTYLASRVANYRTQYKFFKLYDHLINEHNIKCYFFTPTPILVQGIVKGELDLVSTYIIRQTSKPNGKRKSRTNKG